MNQLIIECRLTKPVDFKQSKAGDSYAVLSLAQSSKNKAGEWESIYVNATCFKYVAQKCEGLQKGDRVLVSGSIKMNVFQDKMGANRYSINMIAQSLLHITKTAQSGDFADSAADNLAPLNIPTYDTSSPVFTDDLPF